MKNNRENKSIVKWFLIFGGMVVIVILVWLTQFQALKSPVERYETPEVQNVTVPQELKSPPRASQSPIAVYEIKGRTIREVSAYNTGDINQGSGNPCISADGENICLALDKGGNRCAANFVPFGTELLIESFDKSWSFQCLVVDRTNKRYRNRVDIAMKKDEKSRAIKFGVQKLMVNVLEKK